jgi:hypothetical protein
MANDRFVSLTTYELQELLENRDSSNTIFFIGAAKCIFLDHCRAKSINCEELIQQPKEEISCSLINFYAEIRKKDGELYSCSSLISIRFGMQRHFQLLRKFDIIIDVAFKLSNEMFKSVMTLLKRLGKANVQHKDVITEADMEKLYTSKTLDITTAQGLQYIVLIDIMLYTCRGGRENLRKMIKADFN